LCDITAERAEELIEVFRQYVAMAEQYRNADDPPVPESLVSITPSTS
jgi:hypothetical protein